jgi:hypothetical protein
MKKGAVMETLLQRVLGQFDSLVPILGVAHDEIFTLVRERHEDWFPEEGWRGFPTTFPVFEAQLVHGAFLLGYSYAEAYITDLLWEIYNRRRDLLPADKSLTYGEVLLQRDFEALISRMIDSTLTEMNSLERKLDHLGKRFRIGSPQPEALLEAHVTRNALVHNMGRVNREPKAGPSRWKVGDQIRLSADDVQTFGIAARKYIREVHHQAERLIAVRQG